MLYPLVGVTAAEHCVWVTSEVVEGFDQWQTENLPAFEDTQILLDQGVPGIGQALADLNCEVQIDLIQDAFLARLFYQPSVDPALEIGICVPNPWHYCGQQANYILILEKEA